MVLCRRQIPSVHSLLSEPPFNVTNETNNNKEAVCQNVNQMRLGAVMTQLAALADYATDVFTNILQDANATHNRIQELAKRTSNLQQSLPTTKLFYADSNVVEKMNKQVRTAFTVHQAEERELMSQDSRPKPMNQSYLNIDPPPNFTQFPNGEVALKHYTNPQYFIEQWVAEQRKELALLKAERKKRRKEKAEARRIKKKAEVQAKALPRIQRIQYDPATGKALELTHTDEYVSNQPAAGEEGSDQEGSEEEVRKLTVSQVQMVLRKDKRKPDQDLFDFGDAPPPQGDSTTTAEDQTSPVTPPPVPRRVRQAPAVPSDDFFDKAQVTVSSPVPPALSSSASSRQLDFPGLHLSTAPTIPIDPRGPEPGVSPRPPPVATAAEPVSELDNEPQAFTPVVPPALPPKLVVSQSPHTPILDEPKQSEAVPSPVPAGGPTGVPKPPPPPPPGPSGPPPPPPPGPTGPPPPKPPPLDASGARMETKPIVVGTSALLEQIRSGIQRTKLIHVERTPQQQPAAKPNLGGFNSNLVDGLLRLRKDIESSESLSEGWDDDEENDE